MSKQTVQNMKLIILEMDKQISSNMGDFKALKALSHSYETLLLNLKHTHEDLKDNKLTSEIESQQKAIVKINSELESKSIPELLKLGNYLEVNHLTTTNTRLLNIVNVTTSLLYSLYKAYNPKVLIAANHMEKAYEQYKLIAENSGETVIKAPMNNLRSGMIAMSNKNTYYIIEFSNNYRGQRVDYAIIDSKLSTDEINNAIAHLKDKSQFRMF